MTTGIYNSVYEADAFVGIDLVNLIKPNPE
jgi:hypothetical protein